MLAIAIMCVLLASVFPGAPPASARAAGFDPVLYWNGVLLDTFRQVGGPPTPLARAAAMMHVAIYDALRMTKNVGAWYRPAAGACDSDEKLTPEAMAAGTGAAHRVLSSLFPEINFDDERDHAIQQVDHPYPDQVWWGEQAGRCVANYIVQERAPDGSAFDPAYTPGTRPGDWQETGSGQAATPNWWKLKPFAMTSSSQFRPGLPGGVTSLTALLASQRYATDFNEVKRVGKRDAPASDRSAENTQIAFFWANDLDRTYKPPGQHLDHTQRVARDRNLSVTQNARLFALVSLAMADAGVTAWSTKYTTDVDLWRPEMAIAKADTDGNPNTQPQAGWLPLSQDRNGVSFSPPFPAYTSGHATFGAAWAGIMKRFFGTDAITFVVGTDDPKAVGVTRRFTSFSQAAREDADSRIYLGVHYRFDADFGLSSGENVAAYVYTNYLKL